MTKPLLILIDGNSFMHRAFHSVVYLSNISGEPTNAITGFLKMLNGIIEHNDPAKLVFVFDAKGKTFRHDLYDDYKGDRKKTDPALKSQFPVVKEIIKHWGFPQIEVEGVEADDTLVTLAHKGVEDGYQVYISTSDKDMYQSVSEDILILDTKSADKSSDAKPVGIEGTIKKFGVKPNQIIDYLSLLGDKADNIPGVDGCGEKTAAKLLAEHGNLESIISNADSVKGKAGKSLQNGFDFELSRQLITIKTDVNTGELSSLNGERNEDELYKISARYELRDFIGTQGLTNPNPSYNPVNLCNNFNELLASMDCNSIVNHTIEIDVTSPFKQVLITDNESNKMYSISRDDMDYPSLIEGYISSMNASKNKQVLTTDSKELIKELGSKGLGITFPEFKDYRIYHYNRFSRDSQILNFDYINFWSASIKLSELRSEFKLDSKKPVFKGMTVEQYLKTKTEEHFILSKAISKIEPHGIYSERPIKLDHAYMHVLAHKEINGVGLSIKNLDIALEKITTQRETLQVKIDAALGYSLKTSSPKEVKEALFNKLNIPIKKPSTNAKDLEPLVKDYPIVGWIIEIRSMDNLISTYVKGFKKRAEKNGRVYATYLATRTASSRVSCVDPNLMAIPNASKSGNSELIRSSFIAQQQPGKENRAILAVDCSQAELRILAGLANCAPLIEAFNNGEDIHNKTGELAFEDYQNTESQRRGAKAINFGLVYGLSPSALAKDLDLELPEAKELKTKVQSSLGNIDEYHTQLVEKVKVDKYYKTVTERIFHFGNVNASNSMVSGEAIRSLKSVSNQAVVSDIIKEASVNIFENVMTQEKYSDVIMMMQIHDELIFELPKSLSEEFSELVKKALKEAMPLDVTMECTSKVKATL